MFTLNFMYLFIPNLFSIFAANLCKLGILGAKSLKQIQQFMNTSSSDILTTLTELRLSYTQPELDMLQSADVSLSTLRAARIAVGEIGLDRDAIAAMLLKTADAEQLTQTFGKSVATMTHGLRQVDSLYQRHTSYETENFRKLLMTFAEDVRVVLIIIALRLQLMRELNEQLTADSDFSKVEDIANETSFLYAPLAHRLGLYAVKTELEDLSLKFKDYTTYKQIAAALHETKKSRDAYIESFIQPLKQRLEQEGLVFHMKGRTKSIHSIYNKMQKQHCDVEHIYDLFAIRIILDAPIEKEKAWCWQVYSIVADMYQPNPKRMRDWLTIPKSNGYESLHTTVLGPENKWVEVQIRTTRMDEIAEKGVAAHWKYKGIKSETDMDSFLKGVREMLENPDIDNRDAINDFRLTLYDEEVFVFTPNGDLHKLPQGATVLDFAFQIHSALGCKCVGGKIGGRNVPIRHKLQNGDQIEILTSPSQKPSRQWLDFVKTSKAKNKIRQALKEIEFKNATEGRELLERRLRNWKLEYDEKKIAKLALKIGYKSVSDFYQSIANGSENLLRVKELIEQAESHEVQPVQQQSADSFELTNNVRQTENASDVLVIDSNIKNVDYHFAKCCNPIYGDDVFGFVSITNGISIHRRNCPNAAQMLQRFPYRIVETRWSGKPVGSAYPITLQVVGNDDIGIVTNMTSVINKESGVLLRNISIDSHDGLFDGQLTIMVTDKQQMELIIKKLATIKGVKRVTRL